MADILVATTGFHTEFDGVPTFVPTGTTVREGHPLLKLHSGHFAPLVVDYEYKPLAVKAAQAATRKLTTR